MAIAGDISSSQKAVGECLPAIFEEVKDVSSEEFREAMKIYAVAFPEGKWRPISSIESMVSSGRLRLIIGRTGGRVVLMSTMYPLKGTPFVLGDYIAVAEECRGRGISRQFNLNIFKILEDLKFEYLLAEVENPYLDGDTTKMRRVSYYRRLGMKDDCRHLRRPVPRDPIAPVIAPSAPVLACSW